MGQLPAAKDPALVGGSLSAIISRSHAMRGLLDEIARVAPFDASVLITGPSGTGKELIARELHGRSPRSKHLFVPVDCASLTGDLMVSQLFGHQAGAFTGADHAALGCFRAANRGTLFLDEIGEIPPGMQAKLLRVIQEREVVPVGSHEATPIDVRIVAATNRDLKQDVVAGRFREDLYFRINVITIHTIPLADRCEDVAPLAEFFLSQMAREGHPTKTLSPGAVAALERFTWPGNVRQLKNLMEQAAIEAGGELIGLSLIRRLLSEATLYYPADADRRDARMSPPSSLEQDVADEPASWQALADVERDHIVATLEHTYYNRSAAARLLGITRQALIRKMAKHEIPVPRLPGKAPPFPPASR